MLFFSHFRTHIKGEVQCFSCEVTSQPLSHSWPCSQNTESNTSTCSESDPFPPTPDTLWGLLNFKDLDFDTQGTTPGLSNFRGT